MLKFLNIQKTFTILFKGGGDSKNSSYTLPLRLIWLLFRDIKNNF